MSKLKEDKLPGGLAAGMTLNDIAKKHGISVDMLVAEFKKGIGVEMEHTSDREVAKEITLDHLFEDPQYYTKLIDMETGMNESSMGEIDILAKESKTFKDFVKAFHKEYSLIELDREALKWLEGIYNNKSNESVNEESYKVAGRPVTLIKGKKSDATDWKVKFQNGKETSLSDVLALIKPFPKGVHWRYKNLESVNESDLKGYLVADVVDDIIKSIGSKFVSGEIKQSNKNKIYLKLKDVKFGSGVVKILKSRFGIDAKEEMFGGKDKFGSIPSVSFFANKVVSESVNEEKVYIDYLNKAKGFKQDRIKFNSYEDAVKWARNNFDKFSPDMIKYESVNEAKQYKKGDKLKLKLPNGKKFDVVFVDYSNTKGIAFGKFKDDGEVFTKPFSLSSIVESKDGLERVANGLPQTEEEPINEWRAEEVLQQLGGKKFITMTGAKNFVKNDPKKQIIFKIGGGAKGGINYVRISLTSMDLYTVEFLKARGTELKVVAVEKGVYNDQLQQIFTKHTGFNTKL
jgi:hypothetical protein